MTATDGETLDWAYSDVIDRGVALLDAKLGRDVWLPRLNLDILDVGSAFGRCVACEATGEFAYAEAFARLNDGRYPTEDSNGPFESYPSWTHAHGFGLYRDPRVFTAVDSRDFGALTEAWRRRVRALREEVS